MTGLPGTGKSTLANSLLDSFPYDLHSTFNVKRDFGHKVYRPKQSERVFDELLLRIEQSLNLGRGVVVDTTCPREDKRNKIYQLGLEYSVEVLVIECICLSEIAKRRIGTRVKNKGRYEEATNPKVYDKYLDKWEDINLDGYNFGYVRWNSELEEFVCLRENELVRFL